MSCIVCCIYLVVCCVHLVVCCIHLVCVVYLCILYIPCCVCIYLIVCCVFVYNFLCHFVYIKQCVLCVSCGLYCMVCLVLDCTRTLRCSSL